MTEPIPRALILAAGFGSRLREGGEDVAKPLQTVGGITLLSRTISTLAAAGVTQVWVVVGFRGDEIRDSVAAEAAAHAHAGVSVGIIDNPRYERSNGVSVLCARGRVPAPFLLSMADHVYDVDLPRAAAAADMQRADLWLCVDRRIGEVYDPDDATKVLTCGDAIGDIGKNIPRYDCIDTGVFAVGEPLLDALEAALQQQGDCSLSDGVRALAQRGRARVIDVGSAFWQDVDTPPARARAEQELARRQRDS